MDCECYICPKVNKMASLPRNNNKKIYNGVGGPRVPSKN